MDIYLRDNMQQTINFRKVSPFIMSEERNNKLANKIEEVELHIPKHIPHESIKLEKTPRGYTITVDHKVSRSAPGQQSESTFFYTSSQNFEKSVKNVSGRFNDEGLYEITVEFDDK